LNQDIEVMVYKVALRHTDEGFSVWCPGLAGCWSEGATEEEALENIQDAIQEYLAAAAELVESGDLRQVEVQL
jgi:predicted RNase H-like HicB family nuclease